MNIVNFSAAEEITMTSREIAELTGKRHKDVLYDIEVMFYELGISPTDFAVALPDSQGRMKPCFQLPKRETLILVTGYSIPMCQRVIERWEALEALEALETGEAWEALETGMAVPAMVAQPYSSAVGAIPASVEALMVAEVAARMLRLEGSAALDMARKATELTAPHLLPMMPVYH